MIERRGQQQEEERPVSFVFGSGSAAFRTLHDDSPFGCAHVPPPRSAALLQDLIKNWKSIGHPRSVTRQRRLMGFPEMRENHLRRWSLEMPSWS
jgi:hypothetical protein